MKCLHCNSVHTVVSDISKISVKKLCLSCGGVNIEYPPIQHPIVGSGTKIWEPQLSNIHPSVKIGENCVIHSHVWIGENVVIGNGVKIQAFSFIPTGVTIENNVFIGPRVTFTNDKYPPSQGKGWEKTIVRNGAIIGAGSTILPGLEIGRNARIGAGSVVTKSVPEQTTVCGNPAKPHNKR